MHVGFWMKKSAGLLVSIVTTQVIAGGISIFSAYRSSSLGAEYLAPFICIFVYFHLILFLETERGGEPQRERESRGSCTRSREPDMASISWP